MAILKPAPSGTVRQAFVEGITRMTEGSTAPGAIAARSAVLGGAAPNQEAHRVFSMGLQDLADNKGIEAARPSGWRFLASTPAGGAAAGEVSEPAGGQPAMTRLAHGSEVAELLKSAGEVEKLPEVEAGSYEMRAIEIPALLIQAFWLKSQTASPDLVVPVRSLSKGIELMHPYTADEFLRIVQPMAEERLKFDDTPRIVPR